MPLVLMAGAFIGRQVIQMAVTIGAIELADKLLFPAVESAVAKIASAFGISEEEAKDVLANEWIDTAEAIGVGALVLKSRLPLRVADYLKFTTKGTTKRAVPATTTAKINQAKGVTTAAGEVTAAAVESIAKGVATARGVSSDSLYKIALVILGVVGTTNMVYMNILNTLDVATWSSSAYQNTFQKIFSIFGLEPDKTYGGPRVASQEVFDKVYTAVTNEGITTIRHPETGATLTWNQQNALLVIDKLASKLFIETGSVKAKDLVGLTLALTNYNKSSTGGAPNASTGSGGSSSSAAAPAPVQIKLYTGVVGGGTLGVPSEFVARPNDMIDSPDELKAAAKNNLAAFVQALPGKFAYEIGIVNSVKTRGGFSIKGEPVKVISGYTKNGTPRYKTVYHKFAVMKLNVTDENGRIVKLGSITLGPVNAVDYQPTSLQLQEIQSAITPELFTNDIRDVLEVATPQSLAVVSLPSTNPNPPAYTEPIDDRPVQVREIIPATFDPNLPPVMGQPIIYKIDTGGTPGVAVIVDPWTGTYNYPGRNISYEEGLRLLKEAVVKVKALYTSTPNYSAPADKTGNVALWERRVVDFQNKSGEYAALAGLDKYYSTTYRADAPTPSDAYLIGRTTTSTATSGATTLAAYYAAAGKPLPSLAERKGIYEALGLGPASTYAGTAEQNNRLLATLKEKQIS